MDYTITIKRTGVEVGDAYLQASRIFKTLSEALDYINRTESDS